MASGSGSNKDVEGGSGASGPPRKIARNAAGMRTDVAWKHCNSVDGDARKVKCKYCEKVFTGGVYRFKHHLAGTAKDVGSCRAVPEDIQKEMMIIVSSLQEKLLKKSGQFEGADSSFVASEEGGTTSGSSADIFKRKIRSQATMNNMFKKNIREEACQDIALFFYNNAIPFNVARSEEYRKMFESVARHGQGFNPPSYHEIRVKYLKHHVDKTNLSLDDHRAYWKKSGCTIMTDGWTDKRRRTILNFLVNSPLGTVFLKSIDASNICKTADKIFKMMDDVVEEVGEENVVHIVTDNAANYKAAGDLLMRKRNKLYWTPCAAHCIDLMLEDFEKKIPLHKDTIASAKRITTYIYSRTSLIALLHTFTKGGDLIRPGLTRFATSYLTLGCLNENKGSLTRMFTSEEWTSSQLAKTKDGKLVENLITDKEFWKNVLHCMRGAFPLIKVLRLVDSDDKPAMGFIYEEMDRAKEKIQNAFRGVESSYMPIWEIIDQRWDNQLHRPLHAAGYYLNPMLHYSPGFKVDWEVKKGFIDCMERLVGDIDIIGKIDDQLEDFKKKRGLFGHAIAQRALQTKTPADWWDSYGDGHPELQKFAIRVLSLTCSSSGCERNWSMFEMVHTKRRNRLMQKTMNDVVFVMANSRLNRKRREVRKPKIYTIEDISFDDEWIVEENAETDDFNAMQEEEDLLQVEDNVGNDGAHVDDLDVPPIDEDDIVGIGDGVGDANFIINVNDNEVDDNCEEDLNALLND